MKMRLSGVVILLLIVTAAATQGPRLYTHPALPPAEMLDRLNLTLAWHTRVAVDGQRDGLFSLQLLPAEGRFQFIVQTRQGAVVALDAETGDLLWQTQVGPPYWPAQPVAFNSHGLYVMRRGHLYALDRNTGKQLFKSLDPITKLPNFGVTLTGMPSAAPVANELILYIPQGPHLTALELPFEQKKGLGTILEDKLAQVVETGEPKVLWDVLFLGLRIEQPLLLAGPALGAVSPDGTFFAPSSQDGSDLINPFRTGQPVTAAMGQFEDIAYLASENANLYALKMGNTDQLSPQLWRFPTEAPIFRKPDVTTRDVYVSPARVGLIRVDRKTGAARWVNSGAVRFLAVNNDFVYATDRLGRFLVLDYVRGTTLAVYDLRDFTVLFHNELTDRVYLGSHDGQIICLRHRDQRTPLLNKLPPPLPPKLKEKTKAKEEDKKPEPPGDDEDKKPAAGVRGQGSGVREVSQTFWAAKP